MEFASDVEMVRGVFYSVRAEALAPRLRELSIPIRRDSYVAPVRSTSVTSRLSDADLSTHGLERRALKALTEKCPAFGVMFH